MQSITLQTNDIVISSGDILGQLQFAASAESDGGASRYVVGKIYAQGEGAFNASSNPASIVFATSAADNLPASGKIKINHEGHILPLEDDTYDLGSSNLRFRNLYLASGIAATGTFDTIIFNTGIGDIDQVAGQTNWNYEAGTLEIGLTNDLKLQVGQTVLFRVKNSTGSTLSKGQAVYASGVLGGGQIIQAAPFAVDNSVDEVRFIGLMTDDLANGEDGFVNHFGHIKNIDLRTSNTVINPNGETWAVGDILFVDDTTAGGLTKVQPQDDIYVALVLADGQNGELFVRITDPGHIGDLHDVNTSGVVDNNFLVWNNSSNYWEPSTNLTFNGSGLQVDDGHIIIDNINTNDPYIKLTGGSTGFLTHTGSALIAWDVSSNLVPKRLNFIIDGTVDSSPILQITSENKVGINKSDAGYELDVVGSGHFTGDLYVDQNVGIGTTSPSAKLDVNGSVNVANDVIVGGNVTINGTTVTANAESMQVKDPIITLGLASGNVITNDTYDRGLALVTNNATAFMGWDNSADKFVMLSSGVATNSSGNYDAGTYGDLHIGDLTATDGIFSGNVGIGESSPTSPLYVRGKGFFNDDAGNAHSIEAYRGGSTNSNIKISNGDGYWAIGKASDGFFGISPDSLNTNAGSVLAITTGGNVGIGDTTPSYKLEVNGTAGFQSTINAPNLGVGEDNSVVILDSDGKLRTDEIDSRVWGTSLVDGVGSANHVAFWSNANTLTYDSSQLYWDSSNNRLGIGTNSPFAPLDLRYSQFTPASNGVASPTLLIEEEAAWSQGIQFFINNANTYNSGKPSAAIGVCNNSSALWQSAGCISSGNPVAANGFVAYRDSTTIYAQNNGAHRWYSNTGLTVGSNFTPSEKMTLTSAGDVGIGTTSPSTQLDVAGSGNFSGDVTIDGHLSAATKSFLINHPTREGHKLQYGSLESPYHGVRLTGRARVDNGWCVVKLPEYISELVHNNNDINIQITNIKHGKVLYVDDTNIANNEFTVKTDSWFNRSGLEFYWTFTAVRKDVKELQVEF